MSRFPRLITFLFAGALVFGCSTSNPADDPDLTISPGTGLGFGAGGIGGVPGGNQGSASGTGGVPGSGETVGQPGDGTVGTEGGGTTTGGGEAGCSDADNDGYGPGCFLGEDCDDSNPNFQADCPDCAAGNVQGCPCVQDGQVQLCFSGDPALEGVGSCTAGERSCVGGFWTGCVGEVPPEEEVCDYADNDCDGEVDEGVLSACGNCDKFCALDDFGPGTNDPFDIESEPSEAVEKTDEGWVTLSENAFSLHFIWIANSNENTVSKLDTITGKELARYSVCSNPSRTAVDKNGDCWVGCRNDGRVMKITNFVENCADKNGNGVIETSIDTNGDGTVSSNEIVSDDECIALDTKPEAGENTIRGLGIDNNNYPWVGLWNQAKVLQLHPDTGSVTQSYSVGANPYGLAIDKSNNVWVAGRGGGKLVKVTPAGNISSYSPNYGSFDPYGITVDINGDVWIGNCCGGNYAWRFNPGSEAWTNVNTNNRPRGVAGGQDGYLYVANDENNQVAKIDLATLNTVAYAELGSGRFPVGIAVDPQGYVWAVNQSSSSASKIDPNTMSVILEQPVGSGPYTYSDMTGATFFQDIAPEGFFTETYGGWEGVRVVWESIDVDYDAPAGTYIDLQLRTGDTLEELEAAEWTPFLGPFPPNVMPVNLLDVLQKKADYLQVRVFLYTTADSIKPFVKGITVQYTAQPEGN